MHDCGRAPKRQPAEKAQQPTTAHPAKSGRRRSPKDAVKIDDKIVEEQIAADASPRETGVKPS